MAKWSEFFVQMCVCNVIRKKLYEEADFKFVFFLLFWNQILLERHQNGVAEADGDANVIESTNVMSQQLLSAIGSYENEWKEKNVDVRCWDV